MRRGTRLTARATALLSAMGLAAGGALVFAAPASAASVCGAGYSYLASHAITVPSYSTDYRYGTPGTKTGSVDVYWNPTARRNCTVAWAWGSTYGVSMLRYNANGSYPAVAPDEPASRGYYSYYAGPNYTATQPSGGSCITLDASFGANGSYGALHLDRVHC
ncbi:MAG: hypothetical protein ABIW80_06675 [Lapillicoccus sp.]